MGLGKSVPIPSAQKTSSAQKKRTYGSSKIVSPKEIFNGESDDNIPSVGGRTFLDKHDQTISTIYDETSVPLIKEKKTKYQPLQNLSFFGLWFRSTFPGQQPKQRTATCYAYSEEYDIFVIAYGKSSTVSSPSGNDTVSYYNDAWALDFSTRKWRCINSKMRSPRIGARAVFVGSKMYIFGGIHKGKYLSDLHSLDILSGEVEEINTTGKKPNGRATPVFTSYKDQKLVVWGGYNGESTSVLYELDLKTLIWEKHMSYVAGKNDPCFAQIDNKLFIFGSSKRQGLLQINLDTYLFEEVFTTGIEPPSSANGSAMEKVGKYLVVYGGTGHKFTHFHAYDIERKWWFVFPLEPDGRTVKFEDGKVLKNGLFMVPSEDSFAYFYRKRTKEIFSAFGKPYLKNKVLVNRVYLGEAIPVLNAREDMLEMLSLCQ